MINITIDPRITERIIDALKQLGPRWKTGDPVQDGYYWMKRNDLPGEQPKARIVRIKGSHAHYEYPSEPVPLNLLSDQILEWYGPLKEPS